MAPWAAVCSVILAYIVQNISADCGSPPIYNDKTHTNYASTYYTGDSATYSCVPGYDVQSGAADKISNCQADGSWSSVTLTCTPGSCPSISAPAHGAQSSYDYRVGQQVQFTCNEGYSLQGDATTTCLTDRTWSQPAPTCIVVSCPSLANPANGQVSSTDTTYGTIVTYTCTNGYIYSESSNSRQCQGNSTWSGVNGQCDEVDCGIPYIHAGTYTLNGGTTYAYYAKFSCDAGTLRVPSADDLSQCNAQQQWEPPPPKCYGGCSTPAVDNAQPFPTAAGSNSAHNTVVTVRCLSGYEVPDGRGSLTCFNGTWTPETLACVLAPTEASVTTRASTRELPPPQTSTVDPSEASVVATSSSTQLDTRNATSIDDRKDGITFDGTDNPRNGTSDLANQRKLWLVIVGCSSIAALPMIFGFLSYVKTLKKSNKRTTEASQAQSSKTGARNQPDQNMNPEKKFLLKDQATVSMPETSNGITASKF